MQRFPACVVMGLLGAEFVDRAGRGLLPPSSWLLFLLHNLFSGRIPWASYTINPLRLSNNSQIKCLLEDTSVYKLPRKKAADPRALWD